MEFLVNGFSFVKNNLIFVGGFVEAVLTPLSENEKTQLRADLAQFRAVQSTSMVEVAAPLDAG